MKLTHLVVALFVAAGAANAAPKSAFHEQPSGPRALPGDNLPPFAMLDDAGQLPAPPPLPPGVHLPKPHDPPETTAPSLSLDDAMRVARAAVASCGSAGYRVGATVVDSEGQARAMINADGADGSHVFVAMRKAIVTTTFNLSSAQAREAIAEDPVMLKRVTAAMFVEGGAVPILRAGKLIGAIGVSGAAGMPIGHQDEVCAAAGLAALNSRR